MSIEITYLNYGEVRKLIESRISYIDPGKPELQAIKFVTLGGRHMTLNLRFVLMIFEQLDLSA